MIGSLWDSIRVAVSRLQSRPRRRPRRNDNRTTLLRYEALEPRRLLAVSQINYNAATQEITVSGTSDDDVVSVFTSASNVVTVRAQTGSEVAEASFALSSVSQVKFYGKSGNDRFENGTSIASEAFGDDGDDVLIGGGGSDRFLGGAGNDVLLGNGGNDELHGQDGDDRINGGAGNDLINAGAGNDFVVGGAGNDRLYGTDGNDEIRGEAGDDEIYGGDGHDILYGGDGDDRIYGDLGNDRIYGDAGHDQLHGQAGRDYISGGDGDDLLTGSTEADLLFGGAGHDMLDGGDGDDALYGDAGNDRLLGGDGNDRLDGGTDDDDLLGGFGDDRLDGGNGNDRVNGQDGDDLIRGAGGNDVLVGGNGKDLISGGMGNDRIYGQEGNDDLRGDFGDDQLFGGDGYDAIYGGEGNDQIFGESDDDRLYGGTGSDLLVGHDGNDRLDGGGENDTLNGGNGNDELFGGDGNDQIYGGEDDDRITGDGGDDRLFGEGGNDHVEGRAGNDYIQGGLGSDRLFGGDDHDEIFGQDGDDWLVGDAGNDRLLGGSGNDYLFGGDGGDFLDGGDGLDELWGGDGNDQLFGLVGNSFLFGGAGNDQLFAAGGSNVLVGGDGDDTLIAGLGRDLLIGGAGTDGLDGGAGDDLLIGGATAYDESVTHLATVMAAWTSTAPYASRVAAIQDELFLARLESEETVFDDLKADTVFGREGDDWFFLTGYLGIYDPNLADHEHSDHEHQEPAPDDSHDHTHPSAVILSHLPAVEGFALIDSLDKLNDRQATETLSTLIPHADDPVLQREHLALFQLVRYSDVTHWAVQSGNWSDPSTWHDGIVPGAGARVLVPIGIEVTVDRVLSQRINTVRVDGTLSFATNVNSELRVDTVVVSTTGAFEMGTASQPIAANVRARLLITDNGPIDRVADPFGISRGLISHGSVTMYGAAITPFAALQGSVSAGANVLELNVVPSGWKIGDKIVIASSTPTAEQNEVRTILGLSGNRVLLGSALSYNHVPPAGMQIHVANITRNVVIESENLAIDRRGHTMFMHNRDVHIANAGFYGMGRTNKLVPINDPVVDTNWQLQPGTGTNPRARYPVHFHRNGLVNDGNPSVIQGSAVVDAPGWGFVNHSSYVDMMDNVAFNVRGAGFATEVGDEIGSFHRNISIGSTGSGQSVESRVNVQDFGHQGDGFWFQGSGISVVGNIAAGNQGSAFFVFSRGLFEGGVQQKFLSSNLAHPEIADGAEEVDVRLVPMLEFRDNVGYASGIGLSLWYQLERATHSVQSVFADSDFWNNSNGAQIPYSTQTVLRNLRFIYADGVSAGIGIDVNSLTQDIVYQNLTISGYTRGIVVPQRGYARIEGGIFSNMQDIFVLTAVAPNRSLLVRNITGLPGVYLVPYFRPTDFGIEHVFYNDTLILDYGPFVSQRLYYHLQLPDAVPFPTPGAGIPSAYVGLTSLQLWNQFGVAVAGGLAPSNATNAPSVSGGVVGPAN